MAQQKHPSSRRYPPEVKERAVQLVLTTMQQRGERTASSRRSRGSSTSAPRRCGPGSARPRSTTARDRGRPPRSAPGSSSSRRRTASSAGPTRF
jgi:hypothetical protein